MFICICNAVRDTELREAALTCHGDAEAVYAALGRIPQCGQCLDDADAVIEEERLSRPRPACMNFKGWPEGLIGAC
jgi:bacterioferritin-associated ferredoxin